MVCSTSLYLLNNILKKAGDSVKQEYTNKLQQSDMKGFETNAGALNCRRILFLPWETNKNDNEAFYKSIRDFVRKAMEHAIAFHHTSIAFPSIGCGQLQVDKNVVANEMLVEAQKQLLTANVLLEIIFVILPGQKNVLEAFQTKLDSLRKGHIEEKYTQLEYKRTSE